MKLAFFVLLGSPGLLGACSSNPSTPTQDAGTDSGHDAGSGALTVTPSTANVLTCDTLQLQESGGSGNGTWSVSPSVGAIAMTGLYTAPKLAPQNPGVMVSYAEPPQSASAQLQVATAFPGTPVPVAMGANDSLQNVPFDHQFTAVGSQIYAGLINTDALHVDVLSSSNKGASFTTAGSYHAGFVGCATVAVDAGNPQVVYLIYQAGHGDSTTNTGNTVRLAVSTDGAHTFPTEYVIADSFNGIINMTCPDVVSPSPGHVLVLGAVVTPDGEAFVGTWPSSTQGTGIGPVGTPLTCTECPQDGSVYYAPNDTNTGAAQATYDAIATNGGGYSARAGTNGTGDVCFVFQYYGGNDPDPTEVQCSTDNGATWTAPVHITSPSADAGIHPTIAVSPGGKVAVAWIDTVGTLIQTFIAISTDGGHTFGAPIQYPQTSPSFGGTLDPVVAWETDDILWLSQTASLAINTLLVDKTCDMGMTWSGAVQVGQFQGTSLRKTTTGLYVGALSLDGSSLSMLSLTP